MSRSKRNVAENLRLTLLELDVPFNNERYSNGGNDIQISTNILRRFVIFMNAQKSKFRQKFCFLYISIYVPLDYYNRVLYSEYLLWRVSKS